MNETNNILILDHTADMGFQVTAPTQAAVFECSALALTTILTDTSRIAPVDELECTVAGHDIDTLMYNWLSEILYQFDGEKKLFSSFSVSLQGDNTNGYQLQASLKGSDYNAQIHEIKTYVKAITFHQMEILDRGSNWSARVFIDI